MLNFLTKRCALVTVILMVLAHVVVGGWIPSACAQEFVALGFEGEYSGQLSKDSHGKKVDVGLEVTAGEDNEYRAVFYYGGLPGEMTDAAEERVELEGCYRDFTLRLEGDVPLRLQYIHDRFTALDEQNGYVGHLERVVVVHPGS